jgi:hypothetical protein
MGTENIHADARRIRGGPRVIGDVVAVLAGSVLIVGTMYDVFQSVVLPRPAVGRVRFSPVLIRWMWRLWRSVATRPRRLQTREAALAAFAPVTVLGLLILWGFLLSLGYALIFYALQDGLHPRPETFGTTLFFSVGTLLSFIVSGIDATAAPTRLLVGMEAATGFALFALVISLLFSLFSSFQRRETAVVALDALAGAPPSGLQILESCAKHDMPEQLADTFIEWRNWTVDVLESHLSYPLLLYFRSSHDKEAWPNSFAAVMDAATLVLSVVDGGPVGPATLMYKVGTHLIEDMGRYYRQRDLPVTDPDRQEFAEACERLRGAGYRLRDVDTAWLEFTRLRVVYAAWLDRLTTVLALTPAPWIGERSYLPHSDGGR